MIEIKEAIIVEGIYDKMKLEQFIRGTIISTNGFSLLRDRKHMEMIKQLAARQGIVILTDSDRAGFLIRRYIQSQIPAEQIKHAYIPEIMGKEKRKTFPGKEGLKGVEGMSKEIILNALQRAGCTFFKAHAESEDKSQNRRPITKLDLFKDGLSGGRNSNLLRAYLKNELNLPSRLTVNGLLEVLNALFTYEEYMEYIKGFQLRYQKPDKSDY